VSDLRARADRRLMNTYRRMPVTFVRGEGVYLFDDRGERYLDFVSGVAVVSLGHSHPRVIDAVERQARLLTHTSNLYYTEPMTLLAERLCDLLGWEDGRVFFANSGAEANECAIKLVRKWSRRKYSQERYETIAAQGSFHGRTLETLAATGQPAKWESFTPLPPGFVHVPFDDAPAVEAAIGDRTSSVLLEPVQGEGGVNVPAPGYLDEIRRICDAADLAFIADEVQTGFGRTGRWFGYQSSGTEPDVITLAKALANGLPLGACVARGEIAEAFEPGDHATTLGGGPVVCAAALAVLEVMKEQDLPSNASRVGGYLRTGLLELVKRHPLATGVRGEGLLLALQLGADRARDVVEGALTRGLLVNDVTPAAVRLCPPLTVTEEECGAALETLDETLESLEEEAA
jgi:acetylornithine/N-succinyldiaminopimelate aminotransferase